MSTTDSFWLRTAPSPTAPRPVLDLPARVDVVVVGAGLAGLCTALRCAEDGARVAVLEAGVIAGRTTGHSTAKLTALHGATYHRLARGKGVELAARYAAANIDAVTRLREAIDRLGIECALTEATAYTCAATAEGVATIEAEAEAARAVGLPIELVDGDVCEVPARAAVALGGQAHVDPVRLCVGLADAVVHLGGFVLESTRVDSVDEAADGCRVTAGDLTIECDVAVLATHLPIEDPAMLSGRVRPERSYVVAGPRHGPVPEGMYLAVDAGWSVRPAAGPDGPVVLVGGEGHAMSDHVASADHYRALEALARTTFAVEPQDRWSAFDYATTDGLPFIGRLAPHSARRFVATGFHKWGMSHAMVAAVLISDLIAGRDTPYLTTFDATRLLPAVSRDLVSNNLKVAQRFLGDRLKARRRNALPEPGGAAVMQRHGSTVAVACDADGSLHAVDAVCTHLGCIVAFNDAERTWDCPCHGSRFGLDGAVLDGPATTPLRRVGLVLDDAEDDAEA